MKQGDYMVKTALTVYRLAIYGDDITIEFNSENPEKLIGDRSLFGIEDLQLIEDIKAKPFILKRNLHVRVTYKEEVYEFVIPRGYCHDGASIPPFAWLLIGQKTEPRLKLASCVHDYMCEHHVVIGSNRQLSTEIFIILCEVFGKFNKVKRYAMKTAINLHQKLWCGWGN